jgi:hypothetical protein
MIGVDLLAEGLTDDSTAFGIEGEVIDPSSNIRQWDFLH